MDALNILLKLLLSVLIGGVIGWERGAGRRPAGFRTHILVSLGAAVAMLTGEMVTRQYGSGDATRIAAQVVSGIGFLGAGTILKVGVNIKGLTTAASLWATACLGLAAGAGLFLMAGIGLVIVLVTLTMLERMEKRFFYGKMTAAAVVLTTDNPSAVIEHVNSVLLLLNIDIHKLRSSAMEGGRYEVKFEMRSRVPSHECDFTYAGSRICSLPNVLSMKVDEF
jgi:putative Mg2+ transporter-C (MgtC) family protein